MPKNWRVFYAADGVGERRSIDVSRPDNEDVIDARSHVSRLPNAVLYPGNGRALLIDFEGAFEFETTFRDLPFQAASRPVALRDLPQPEDMDKGIVVLQVAQLSRISRVVFSPKINFHLIDHNSRDRGFVRDGTPGKSPAVSND